MITREDGVVLGVLGALVAAGRVLTAKFELVEQANTPKGTLELIKWNRGIRRWEVSRIDDRTSRRFLTVDQARAFFNSLKD